MAFSVSFLKLEHGRSEILLLIVEKSFKPATLLPYPVSFEDEIASFNSCLRLEKTTGSDLEEGDITEPILLAPAEKPEEENCS